MSRLNREMAYWAGAAYDPIRPKPEWTVTWPTLPGGVHTAAVRRASSAADAIKQARAAHAPTNPGYKIAYDREPSVWQIKPGPARRVSGPDYYALADAAYEASGNNPEWTWN